ncbi:MAG: indolepyruvate ferredoxin oxidoreductase subunit alpha [Deltaproteobacteria bacterium]|nr:indolepyruvate ferredoxin oxidoreductase subunit alpha [Deltaproteobacteria bacterium]
MQRKLRYGTAAIAQGAVESGVHLAVACPGEVASAVLAAAERGGLCCASAPSEKAALEMALGASIGGARVLVAVRSGGLESSAGALAAAAAAGATGLAVVLCDDPAARHAPALDSRAAARAAMVPVLEPADPHECRVMVGSALELSERFETPVVVRLTARLADSAGPVDSEPAVHTPPRGWRWRPPGEVPAGQRRAARAAAQERLAQLAGFAWDTPLNRMELRSPDIGVVTSGLLYGMVREALPEASVLKLGLVHPVPTGLVRAFGERVRRLFVIEEPEPFLEQELRAAAIACEGRDRLTRAGEVTPAMLRRAFHPSAPRHRQAAAVPERPPELCPGCPHRATFSALKRLHVTATSDQGCAALAALPPLSAVDRSPALGASVAVAWGLETVLGDRIAGRSVAVVGEGALLHSAAGALAHAAQRPGTVVVADNRLPGGEGSGGEWQGPGGGVHAPGGRRVDLRSLALSLGVPRVREVDPLDLQGTIEALRAELAAPQFSVVIARSPCARLWTDRRARARVEPSRCNRCGACLRLGCPALSDTGETMAVDAGSCVGCGLCGQVCRPGAIEREELR